MKTKELAKTKSKISDEEFDRQYAAAEKLGKEQPRLDPRATGIEQAGRRITLEIDTGWSFSFDPRMLPELKQATDREIADVKIRGAGYTLEWTALDVHFGVGTIIASLLEDDFLISEANRRIARRKTPRKAASSAANGKLGGRPRKSAPTEGDK